jgi:hypothetical protein
VTEASAQNCLANVIEASEACMCTTVADAPIKDGVAPSADCQLSFSLLTVHSPASDSPQFSDSSVRQGSSV